MDMIALAKGKTDGKTGIDADGSTGADEKVSTGKVAGDGGGLLLGEVARPLVGAEGGACGRAGAAEGAAVVVVGRVAEAVHGRGRVWHGRRGGEGGHLGFGILG